jgi:glycosyltransferase involved in cell wall biosynthesis
MNIGIVAPLVTPIREPQLGGSQAVVADLARALRDHGHDVTVYAASGSKIVGVTVQDVGVDAASLASVLYQANRPWSANGEISDAAFQKVYDAVAQASHDIVHNHAFDPPAIRFAIALKTPVVHTVHLPPHPAMASTLNEALRSSNPPIVAAVSESSASGWRRLVRIDVILRNGVPVDRIPWSESGGDRLLFAGRFSAEKGAADAIAIARHTGVPIDVYGDPYDPDYARQHVESHRGEPGVGIHGGLIREELWKRMAAARAVICPVKWDEPFGMVAAEAQAAGAPVIAYPRGALPEILRDGETGFLVPPGDRLAAARAVDGVGSISRSACRRHAEQHLSLAETVRAHERFYAKILDGRTARRHG